MNNIGYNNHAKILKDVEHINFSYLKKLVILHN